MCIVQRTQSGLFLAGVSVGFRSVSNSGSEHEKHARIPLEASEPLFFDNFLYIRVCQRPLSVQRPSVPVCSSLPASSVRPPSVQRPSSVQCPPSSVRPASSVRPVSSVRPPSVQHPPSVLPASSVRPCTFKILPSYFSLFLREFVVLVKSA